MKNINKPKLAAGSFGDWGRKYSSWYKNHMQILIVSQKM